MATVISKDGTQIGYSKIGSGPALILVDGALGSRGMFGGEDPFASAFAGSFTVVTYDRRGRGESGDTLPYAVEREVEDIEALIDAVGGRASLYGVSSGGALVLEAALRLGNKVEKIAIYEVPYNDEPAAQQAWTEYVRSLGELLASDRKGDAVALFMRLVGASEQDVEGMRSSPMFAALESVAPTLAYDHTALLGQDAAVPVERAARVTQPALIMDGGASFPFMHATALKLAQVMPNARHCTLPGQTHEVSPDAIAPVMIEFLQAA